MSQQFDPYHRWLGIPPEDQPADHYRLLGLARFEDDVEVIRDAAERQMGHVRRYGLGKHSELSQRILNELAGAKACLLDGAKRAEYDARLREKLTPSSPLAAGSAPPPPVPIAVEAASRETPGPPQIPLAPVDDAGSPASHRAESPARRRLTETGRAMLLFLSPHRAEGVARRKNVMRWLLITGGGALSGCALLVIVALIFGLSRETSGPSGDPSASGAAAPGLPKADEGGKQALIEARQGPSGATAQPPKLKAIPDQAVEEGRELRIHAEVADAGSVPGPLRYSLARGAPPGAKIDPETGLLTWTPTREQAAAKHQLTVQVTAEEAPEFSDRVSFQVEVRRVVRPPVLSEIPEQAVKAGEKAVFQVRLANADQAPQNLVFSLRRQPRWVWIDKASGTITIEPPASQAGGHIRMFVRVSGQGPKAPHDEKELTLLVLASTPSPGPDAEGTAPVAAVAALAITSPSGRTLSPAAWDVKMQALAAAREMILQLVPDSKVLPLYAGEIGGPLLGLCECQKTSKTLDGRTITFHPGKDPYSCREAAVQRFQISMPGAAFDPREFWREVRCETYVEYRQGNRHGVLATWDAEGRKKYWGQYERDQRHEFCCLFKNDQPAIVLVCDRGRVGAVHLIADGKVAQSFASEEEARGNAKARPLLDELNDFEAQYQRNERALQAQVKKMIQIRLGEINRERRAMEQSRRSARDAAQRENMNKLRKATTGQ